MIRFATNPTDFKKYTTSDLRAQYLIPEVMKEDEITAVYSMHDRMMVLGAIPKNKSLKIPAFEDLTKADFFLERRELGIINVGATGSIKVDGEQFTLENKECLYVGMGAREIVLESTDPGSPAEFYMNACPAHKTYPTKKASLADTNQVSLGSPETSNERVIYQMIHEEGIQSCQLVMGFTILKSGSVWNTFPPHTHLRRMEVYFYFDLPEDQLVMHFMGDPEETRHIAMRNKQAVISPEWSIHAGAGTSSYSFIWSMAGENQSFNDMDGAPLDKIK